MNIKRFQKNGSALLLTLILSSILSGSAVAQDTLQQPSFEEAAQLADMRSAAIRGDRSQIPAIIKDLEPNLTRYHTMTALRALSELQAVEALSAIDAVIARNKGTSLVGFARVVKARIIAESIPVAQAAIKPSPNHAAKLAQSDVAVNPEDANGPGPTLDRFLSLLGLDTTKIKAAGARPADKSAPIVVQDPEATAIYAQLEIADMTLYSSPAYLTLAKVKELDYSQYPGAALKMKVAPMSQEERVKWLIDDLSKKKVVSLNENYEIQLAIDEGLPASHYAASVLKTMGSHQKEYPPMGFHALFMVLDGIWDKADHEVIATFAKNTDPDIKYSSVVYPHYKHQVVTGF